MPLMSYTIVRTPWKFTGVLIYLSIILNKKR